MFCGLANKNLIFNGHILNILLFRNINKTTKITSIRKKEGKGKKTI